jgi:peptidoglycan biosynthesis protein MviN/MurJ (putative lipid II flippase)
MGTDRHKFVARWALVEGISNLTLSVILVHYMGIYGIALGTMLPSLFIHLLIWPGYISRILGISRFDIFVRVWGKMFAAALPFAAASYFVDRTFPAHSLSSFFLQTIVLLPVFLLLLLLVFRDEFRDHLLPALRSRMPGRKAGMTA